MIGTLIFAGVYRAQVSPFPSALQFGVLGLLSAFSSSGLFRWAKKAELEAPDNGCAAPAR